MAVGGHLKDPVKAFQEIEENFLLYVKTAFATKFPSLEHERDRLLTVRG